MQKKFLKIKLLISIVIAFLLVSISATVTSFEEKYGEVQPVELYILESNDDLIRINYKINYYKTNEIEINRRHYIDILLGAEPNIIDKGYPALPKICRSIIIPDDKKMEVRVTKVSFTDYENKLIAPSKGDILRTENPDDVPYVFGSIYRSDSLYPKNIAYLREPYILRDFRGQVVEIYPFQYNPVKRILRVYDEIQIEIYPIGEGGANVFNRDGQIEEIDRDFRYIYEDHFINFGETIDRYTPVPEIGNMLVICYDSFYSTMMPFVEWKNMKGIPTEIINVSEIGTGSANDIDSYIETYYNINGLTFVLLVGDIQQAPSLYYSSHASDPSYSFITTDNYQDLFVGRFSAQSISDLETQVERSIEYEKYPQAGADWYHKGTGIASSGGPGDDGEYDWEHMRNLRTLLMGYTYTEVDEFYDGSQGGEDAPGNPSSSMVQAAVDDGRSIVNYCGHGGPTSWSTSGFSNSNINNLVNDNMLPYVVCVACNNGEFEHYNTCFAEAWMRATNNGEPTGAIGVFASTQSQSWSPPMDAQDEIVDLIVNEEYTKWGAISYSGTMHMMDDYGSSCYDETNTWTFFGDPSLQMRTDTPTSMNVIHDTMIPVGSTTFEVTVMDMEGALCALSQNGELLGYEYSDETGVALITLNEPIYGEGEIDFVVTSLNKIPYITTITIGSLEEEYSIDLYESWNMITIPVENDYTAEDLGQAIDGCTVICMFDASTQTFATHVIGIPHNDFPILDGCGYYVYTTTDSIFTVSGLPIETVNVPLSNGWNLIGWYHNYSTTAESLGQSIAGCTTVTMFNAEDQTFTTHVVGIPHNDFQITAGMGLYVYVNESSIWYGG